MKKVLKCTKRNLDYLNSLPKMYIVGYWAHWGVRQYYFSGKFIKDEHNNIMVPLVYDYDDHNGTDEGAYYLRKINLVTTGMILVWTECKSVAEAIAEKMEFVDANYKAFDEFCSCSEIPNSSK